MYYMGIFGILLIFCLVFVPQIIAVVANILAAITIALADMLKIIGLSPKANLITIGLYYLVIIGFAIAGHGMIAIALASITAVVGGVRIIIVLEEDKK